MKKTRAFTLKLVVGILVLALVIGTGGVYAQTQDNPGSTETGQIPATSPGSSTWEDELTGNIKNLDEVLPTAMDTEGNTPTYTPGIQYEGPAPDENIITGTGTNTPVFSYYLVSGNTFQGKSSTIMYAYDQAGCIHLTSGAAQVNTEMDLPDGSIIKYLRLYYIDTNASGFVTGYISRFDPGVSGLDLVSVSSSGSAGYGTALSSEITSTVVTSDFAYSFIGWPTNADDTVQLCGMRVAYYAPRIFRIALPLLQK
jgi:hypothetical protein